MATIPPCVADSLTTRSGRPLADFFREYGYDRIHQGKVRDSFVAADRPDEILVAASDRISIFDFVLPATVPRKGEALTALTHFWLHWLSENLPELRHHLLQPNFLQFGPDFPAERCLRVQKLRMWDFELILRGHIGGSVWKQYQETGVVAGQNLPPGLQKWQRLESPLFTPSTKSKDGHDVNITVQEFYDAMGEGARPGVELLTSAYELVYAYLYDRGFLILDTKAEMGNADDVFDDAVLGDEIFTPDSSRFTTVADFEAALRENRDPVFWDKQVVREWGKAVRTPFGVAGIHQLDPANPDHLAFVHGLTVPQEVIEMTVARYLGIFSGITGYDLPAYQHERMGICTR